MGTPNKATATTKQFIQELLEENYNTIRDDLPKMTPKDRVTALLSLVPYIVPKQMATAATVAIERLSDEQINDVVEQLLTDIDDEDTIDTD